VAKTLKWAPPAQVADSRPAVLTPREADVLTGLCLGLGNRRIGQTLYITEDTVKSHVKHVLGKLHARDRTHAAALCYTRAIQVTVLDRTVHE
jgi:DNA-binding NarL/FixJ family response regulator